MANHLFSLLRYFVLSTQSKSNSSYTIFAKLLFHFSLEALFVSIAGIFFWKKILFLVLVQFVLVACTDFRVLEKLNYRNTKAGTEITPHLPGECELDNVY